MTQELSYSRNPPFKEYDYGFDREAAIAQFHEYVLKKTGNHLKSRQRTASRAIPCRSRPRSSSSRTTRGQAGKRRKVALSSSSPTHALGPGVCCVVLCAAVGASLPAGLGASGGAGSILRARTERREVRRGGGN